MSIRFMMRVPFQAQFDPKWVQSLNGWRAAQTSGGIAGELQAIQ
jgi:hypothetical protein